MVYIYLFGVYYDLCGSKSVNLDVTKENFVGGRGFPLFQWAFLLLSFCILHFLPVRRMGYHVEAKTPLEIAKEHKATLNDLPVPAGSFKEYHAKRNTMFNMQLGGALLLSIGTLLYVSASVLIS